MPSRSPIRSPKRRGPVRERTDGEDHPTVAGDRLQRHAGGRRSSRPFCSTFGATEGVSSLANRKSQTRCPGGYRVARRARDDSAHGPRAGARLGRHHRSQRTGDRVRRRCRSRAHERAQPPGSHGVGDVRQRARRAGDPPRGRRRRRPRRPRRADRRCRGARALGRVCPGSEPQSSPWRVAGTGPARASGFVSGVDQTFQGPRGRAITGSVEHTAPIARGCLRRTGLRSRRAAWSGSTRIAPATGSTSLAPSTTCFRARLAELLDGRSPQRRMLGVALAPSDVAAQTAPRGRPAATATACSCAAVEDGGPAHRAGVEVGDLLVAPRARAAHRRRPVGRTRPLDDGPDANCSSCVASRSGRSRRRSTSPTAAPTRRGAPHERLTDHLRAPTVAGGHECSWAAGSEISALSRAVASDDCGFFVGVCSPRSVNGRVSISSSSISPASTRRFHSWWSAPSHGTRASPRRRTARAPRRCARGCCGRPGSAGSPGRRWTRRTCAACARMVSGEPISPPPCAFWPDGRCLPRLVLVPQADGARHDRAVLVVEAQRELEERRSRRPARAPPRRSSAHMNWLTTAMFGLVW